MQNNKGLYAQRGFGLIQVILAASLVAILSVIIIGSYYNLYLPTIQVQEADRMLIDARLKIIQRLRDKKCTEDNNDEVIAGEYGTMTISGTYKAARLPGCSSGCKMSYRHYSTSKVAPVLRNVLWESLVAHNGDTTSNNPYYALSYLVPESVRGYGVNMSTTCNDIMPAERVAASGVLAAGDSVGISDPTVLPFNEDLLAGGFDGTGSGPGGVGGPETEYIGPDGSTLNGVYHHKSKLNQIILAPYATKKLSIHPAGISAETCDFTGDAGGATGIYVPKPSGNPAPSFFTATYSTHFYGLVRWAMNYALPYYNWGLPIRWVIDAEWSWDTNAVGGKYTFDGVELHWISDSAHPYLKHLYSVKNFSVGAVGVQVVRITNTTDQPKSFKTAFGQMSPGGGDINAPCGTFKGSNGSIGGTIFAGVPDGHYVNRPYIPTRYLGQFIADGFILIED